MATDRSRASAPPLATVEVFDLLSDPTRLRIVHELHRMDEPAMPFSALARRVDADDGGRFNYHLGRLRGRLVEKVGAGYRLTPAGMAIARTLVDLDPA